MPEVSVIIPVYNVEDKLCRCLDSLMEQTFTDFEVILIDDGSTDNSGRICDEYVNQDLRFQVVHKENRGVSNSRNIGLNLAAGKYIVFVDSDDYVENSYIKVLRDAICKNNQFAICGIYYVSENLENRVCQRLFTDFELEIKNSSMSIIGELLQDRRFNYVYGKIYSKEIIEKNNVRFEEDVSLGEDTVFVMDYLKCIEYAWIIGKAYYNYVKYSSSTLSSKYNEDQFDKYAYVNRYIEKTFRELGWYNDITVKAIGERWVYATIWALDSTMNADIDIKSKQAIIDKIVKNTDIRDILLEDDNNSIIDYNLKRAIMSQKAQNVINYYVTNSIKEKVVRRIKIIVVSIVPSAVIRRIKIWFRIAQ